MVKLTDSQRAEQEIRAKLSDRWWRLNNLYWVANEQGQPVKFVPNRAQTELYHSLWYLNVILKARQLGFTTFIQIFILDACVFNSNQRAGVIAHSLPDVEVIFRDKIKFAYDRLPAWLRAEVPARNDKTNELMLANNSSIRVGTSMRSGTLQYLHVSELGKISRKYPEKAKEIKTGAFNTVHPGAFIFVESTAEGRAGLFFDIVQKSRRLLSEGLKPTKQEFKFHFFPWWRDDRYTTDDDVVLTDANTKYFEKLEAEHGIVLTNGQKAWYAGKAKLMDEGDGETEVGGDMKQEYPSTPDEAFEVQIKGAYYGDKIAQARQQGRITRVPHDPSLPVFTFWDLGRNDTNAIWFIQVVGREYRAIHYYENSGEGLPHYAKYLKDRMSQDGYSYDTHYLPHDANVVEYTRGDGLTRREVLEAYRIGRVEVVERIRDVSDGIEMTRNIIPSCVFDKAGCDVGLKALENYRQEWDEKLGTFKGKPLHNWASNGADAFRQLAQGFYIVPASQNSGRRRAGSDWRT